MAGVNPYSEFRAKRMKNVKKKRKGGGGGVGRRKRCKKGLGNMYALK